MAISKAREVEAPSQREHYARIALAVLVVGGVIGLVHHLLTRPPQMGVDDQVFHTVDALYTAVRSRDEKRLDGCAQRLRSYRTAGKLPSSAADYLDKVIAKARGGNWQSATESLYDFMLAQRREGALPTTTKPAGPPVRVARK